MDLLLEILLIIAATESWTWRIMAISIPDIGRYSLNPKVQERLKEKWKREVIESKRPWLGGVIKNILPNGVNHGKYTESWAEVLGGFYMPVYEKGEYRNGKKEGTWVKYECGEKLYEGIYKNGKKHGMWKGFDLEDKFYEGMYKNDKKHGMWTYSLGEILLEKILEHQKSRVKREILEEFYEEENGVKKIYYKNGVANKKYRIFIGEKKYVFNT